jgi:hypothetical protein
MQYQNFFPQVTTQRPKIIKALVFGDFSEDFHQSEVAVNSPNPAPNIIEAQEIICRFFLDIVKRSASDFVLSEFKNLFINPSTSINSQTQQALTNIILSNNEEVFRNTLKRSMYILLNNWIYGRKYEPAQNLIKIFERPILNDSTSSKLLQQLNEWLANFLNSQDYQEIRIFVSKYDICAEKHWKNRYTSYLLAPQYANSKNSLEHRLAAKALSRQLENKFKFDLAMYTAHSHSSSSYHIKNQNPTALGDEALRLVKKVVAKRGFFSYANLANIFIKQTQNVKYGDFKRGLLKYLFFSVGNQGLVNHLTSKIEEKLNNLYQDADQEQLNRALLMKTCNRIIEYLTISNNCEPSPLFVALASQGNPLTLAILLLKIILICPQARTHLEVCIAKLIQYYEGYSQDECHWVIKFLEIAKIILAIFTDNVHYNFVSMGDEATAESILEDDTYRVFSQQSETNK